MDYKKLGKEVFDIEIDALRNVSKNISDDFANSVAAIMESSGRCVITGMGKSGLVGKKIAATLASTGTRSFFMHPGEAYHGDLGMIHSSDVIIAISNSGETEEIIKLLPFFKENKNTVIAMCGKKNSTLVKHSEHFLNIEVTKEACPLALAPTSSTTATMAMGDAIAVSLMKARDFKAENFARFHPGGSLGRKLLTKVSDLMKTKDLPIVSPDQKFEEVISIISNGRLGLGVVVLNDKVIGVITDGDIRRAIKEEKAKALDLKASEFLTKNPLSISSEEKIVIAEEIMQDKKITTLLVLDNDALVGILHRYDI